MQQKKGLIEIISYVIVGAATTGVNFLLFYLLHYAAGWNENAANAVSITSSVLFAYICNKIFVFHSKASGVLSLIREMLSFFSSRAFTMLLELGGVYLFCTIIGFEAMVVKIALNVVVIVLNYVFSKFLVFNKSR